MLNVGQKGRTPQDFPEAQEILLWLGKSSRDFKLEDSSFYFNEAIQKRGENKNYPFSLLAMKFSNGKGFSQPEGNISMWEHPAISVQGTLKILQGGGGGENT